MGFCADVGKEMGYIREGRIIFANRAFEVEVRFLELTLRHGDNGQEPIKEVSREFAEEVDRFTFRIDRPIQVWDQSTASRLEEVDRFKFGGKSTDSRLKSIDVMSADAQE